MSGHVQSSHSLLYGPFGADGRLDQIQKCLNDYLETKRLAFPRFFFLPGAPNLL